MDRISNRACAAICVAAGIAVLTPREAKAEATITLTETNISRNYPLRDQSKQPLWISRDDCLRNDEFHFPLYVTGYSGLQLEVWAGGSDCTAVAARQTTTATCWRVTDGITPSGNSVTVNVRVQDIVAKKLPPTTGPNLGKESDCSPSLGTTAPVAVSLFFMFIDPSSQANSGGYQWKTSYDLLGPTAPGGLTIGQGDTLLKLEWKQSTTDTDLTGYHFFCDPPPGKEGSGAGGQLEAGSPSETDASTSEDAAADAGADADAAVCDEDAGDAEGGCAAQVAEAGTDASSTTTDAGGSTNSNCGNGALVSGKIPDYKYYCGSANGQTATSGRIEGLQNKYTYAVAIAGVDAVGNVGTLSTVQCGEPWPVDDFFKLYKQAGGDAGGTFCSTGAVGRGAGMATLLVLSIGALGAVVRRRRKNI